jgi:hypothetical protein
MAMICILYRKEFGFNKEDCKTYTCTITKCEVQSCKNVILKRSLINKVNLEQLHGS